VLPASLLLSCRQYVKSAPKVSAKKSKQQQDKARKLADRAKNETARARKQIKKKRGGEKKLTACLKQLSQALAATAGVKRAVDEKLGRDRAKVGKLSAALADQQRELRAITQEVLAAGGSGSGGGGGAGGDGYRTYLVRGTQKLDAALKSTRAVIAGEVRKRSTADNAELDNSKLVVMGLMTPRG